jgi:hypothetical protein
MSLMRRTTLALVLLAAFAQPTLANDFAYGGDGSNLMPLEKTPVRMVSETITIEHASLQHPNAQGWQVRAAYIFENPTAEPLTLKVGFPEFRCDENEGDCAVEGNTFVELTTWVGGREVEMGEGKVSKRHEWSADLDRVHTFEVSFQPRQTQKVIHTYRFAGSSSVWAEHPSYVTRTGALWNGPIGRATFIFRTPTRPYGLTFPKEFQLARYVERLEGEQRKRYVTELVFEQREWVPRGDLELELHHRGLQLLGLRCPIMDMIVEDSEGLTSPDYYLWNELRELSSEELRQCRNLPYAAHGYPFQDPALSELFYGTQENNGIMSFFSRENPEFTPAMLTGDEWIYIRTMKRVEAAREASCKTPPCIQGSARP